MSRSRRDTRAAAGAALLCTLVAALAPIVATAPAAASAQPAAAGEWTGAPEQKLWGLMTVWAEVKYTFPGFDRLPGLDWDRAAREAVPHVLAAGDIDAYYDVLQELVASLRDGHTTVLPPWGHLKPGWDLAPLEVRVLDGRFYIDRVGEAPALAAQGIRPGLEIVAVDGTATARRFEEDVLRLHGASTPQGAEAFLTVYLLYGPAGGANELVLRDADGAERTVTVVRDALAGEHPFMTRLIENAMVARTIRTRTLDGGVLHVEIPNFDHRQAADDFLALVDGLDASRTAGMIVDLRWNAGGDSRIVASMVGALVDAPVSTPLRKFRHFIGAYEAWGREQVWETTADRIAPRDGVRYLGPLVVLTGGLTNSSAEDFAIELRAAGRAVLVGQTTAGSAGNALVSPLPGGGELRVATFTALLPDGEEYVGKGVVPDVAVAPTPADLAAGRDVVLERAVKLLTDRGGTGSRTPGISR